ncbi:hypothetical protein R69619_05444 [Paraburkholderia nemoris]|uniref:hypothetical protein n=1 Tax=Paraburkholderia nemoris TaxID=2793076 RepID=UPI00190B7448|nr:hypothetical protein [Paraburkholderia nemoris]MBK3738149.1 hypothetical protein [Paraburkholderia aspalathi]CAE6806254.1 hypothetical protein R69619_05444 [Paraburkholderia nemoris]
MRFETLFEGKSWPEVQERLGVLSVDTLNRTWLLVLGEDGYLIAIAKDGEGALLGRMCKRDDGKFCIEIVVRAPIENNMLGCYEFWHVDSTDKERHARRLNEVIRDHLA